MIAHQTVDEKVLKNLFSTIANASTLKEYWQDYEKTTQDDNSSQEINRQIKEAEQKKDNLVSAIAAGVIEFGDAKGQIDKIKNELAKLNNQFDNQETPTPEPDWKTMQMLHREEFNNLPFDEQRKAIEAVITSITLYNTYAIINYPFPRTKNGSFEARINIARGNKYKLKSQNRTRP